LRMEAKALSCLLFALALQAVSASAGPRLVVENDSRSVFLVQRFCFGPGGTLDLNVATSSIADKEPDKESRAGFLILKADGAYSSNAAEYAAGESCLLDSSQHTPVLLDSPSVEHKQTFNDDNQGLYYVLFINCRPDLAVTFDVTINMRQANGDYLPAGDVQLPTAFGVVSVAFFSAGLVWVYLIKTEWDSVHKIHLLMLLLVFVKATSLALEAIRFHYLRLFNDGFGWTTAYYSFTLVKGLLLFGVILLIGTGVFILKPFLSERDKKILFVVLPLQVIVNVAMVVVEETPPGTAGWLTWRDILHLFDIICCCAILFPIVWSIRHLREAAEADGKAARNLERLKLFREFYIMVVCYIYFTRIIVYLVRATLACRYTLISTYAHSTRRSDPPTALPRSSRPLCFSSLVATNSAHAPPIRTSQSIQKTRRAWWKCPRSPKQPHHESQVFK